MKRRASKEKDGARILLGIAFLLAGLGLLGLSLHLQFRQSKPDGWKPSPCSIEKLELKTHRESTFPFFLECRFRYSWLGKEFVSTTAQSDGKTYASRSYEDLMGIRNEKASNPVCFINPTRPEEASLFLEDSRAIENFVVFIVGGAIIALIGVGLIRSGLKAQADGLLMVAVFSFFLCGGIVSSIQLLVMPVSRYLQTLFWQKCDATVIWSQVRRESSGRATGKRHRSSTYPDIFYEYRFAGQTHRSNNVSIMRVADNMSGYASKIIAKHPEGTKTYCYINPRQPWRAVLDRKLGWRWLMALFPLPFLAVGIFGLRWGLKEYRKEHAIAARRRARQNQ
jgi:hypothetical protein